MSVMSQQCLSCTAPNVQCRRLNTEGSESSSKYQRAEQGRLAAVAEVDQVRKDLQARLAQAEERAATAEAAVTKHQQENQQLQQRLTEVQQQARAATAGQAANPQPGKLVLLNS